MDKVLYHLLATIQDGQGNILGYRVLNHDTGEIQNVPDGELKAAIQSKSIALENFELGNTNSELVSLNGSIERYPALKSAGHELKNGRALIVINKLVGTDAYSVCTWEGKVIRAKTSEIVMYATKFGIANGKVVRRNNEAHISAIGGKYTEQVTGTFEPAQQVAPQQSNPVPSNPGFEVVYKRGNVDIVYNRRLNKEGTREVISYLNLKSKESAAESYWITDATPSSNPTSRGYLLEKLKQAKAVILNAGTWEQKADAYHLLKAGKDNNGKLVFMLVNDRLTNEITVSLAELILMGRRYGPTLVDRTRVAEWAGAPLNYPRHPDTIIAMSGLVKSVETDIKIKTMECDIHVAKNYVNDCLSERYRDEIKFENRQAVLDPKSVTFVVDSFKRLKSVKSPTRDCIIPSYVTELTPMCITNLDGTYGRVTRINSLRIPDTIENLVSIFDSPFSKATLSIKKYYFTNVTYSKRIMSGIYIDIDTLVVEQLDKLLILLELVSSRKVPILKPTENLEIQLDEKDINSAAETLMPYIEKIMQNNDIKWIVLLYQTEGLRGILRQAQTNVTKRNSSEG